MPNLTRIKDISRTLNVFKDSEKKTPHDLRKQYLSTRLFIVLFMISSFILILYTSLEPVTLTKRVQQPSFAEYTELNQYYTQTLVCPCNTISVSYETFISFQPTYHQICHSDFVSEQWIEYLQQQMFDLSPIITRLFQTLSMFCLLSQQTITDELLSFNFTTFITGTLIPERIFSQQALGFISTFQEGIKSSFSTSLTLITDTTQANGFLTVLETNYLLDYYLDRGFDTEILFYGNCSCGLSSRCLTEIGIWYNNSYILNITGLYVGCFITEALRQSNLVFFYNQSLLNQLQTDFLLDNDTSNVSVTALDPSLPTNYTPATTIGDILKMLMIEDWNSHISYESYFSTCQPISCTYNIIAHNSFIYIVTTAFGLIGGIATSLMFLIPLIVGFIHQRKKISAVPDDEINTEPLNLFQDRIRLPWSRIKNKICTFNIFKNPEKTTKHDLTNQYYATRLFILCLTISMIILIIYTALATVTITVKVKQPTSSVFLQQLYPKYNQTLNCPCTQISTEYKEFISFQPTFHQVCSSDFIGQSWLDYNTVNPTVASISLIDFRATMSYSFLALLTFCELSLETIQNTLLVFNSSTFVTSSVISENIFQLRADEFISLFQETTIKSFQNSLKMISETTQESQYKVNTTIGEIVQQLMIEQWNDQIFYDQYYSTCQPIECAYTYQKQADLIYTITTIIGLLGGVTTVLKLLIPSLVSFPRREKDLGAATDTTSPSPQIIYSSSQNLTQTVKVKRPTLLIYNELEQKYSQTLQCPCSNITVDYQKCVSFQPKYHQICQSDFITMQWINNIGYNLSLLVITNEDDFRQTASVAFQLLSKLCELTQEAVSYQLGIFNSTKFISVNVISKASFESQAENSINIFKQTTMNTFKRSLLLIQSTTQGNTLMSYLLTDARLMAFPAEYKPSEDYVFDYDTSINSPYYNNYYSSYVSSNIALIFHIPGIYVGCYIVDALLHSDLRCFYDQTCLSSLLNAIQYPLNNNVTILNSSLTTQYNTTTTVGDLVQNLMIEQWNNKTAYEFYFNTCQPQYCTYSYVSRSTPVFIITTIIGLIGGLTKVYRLLVPLIVRLIRRYIWWPYIEQKLEWNNNTVAPVPPTVSISPVTVGDDKLVTILV
ncbi:unnamed protein product [Didymodactylos carnosus]|uniref:Uncharacterized protein n=2 Tax=Didymodactylos carnosus TaxID=1234261 RepID=A0A814K0U4_9BILA|nr:unnamed protein product [Didymodactylos carnosus]CAF3815162.1 unnamed protein product [Didymodactylos carnosus]